MGTSAHAPVGDEKSCALSSFAKRSVQAQLLLAAKPWKGRAMRRIWTTACQLFSFQSATSDSIVTFATTFPSSSRIS